MNSREKSQSSIDIIQRHIVAFSRGDVQSLMRDYADETKFLSSLTGIIEGLPATEMLYSTYLDPVSGDPRFCDWQCAAIGPFMIDVPYQIAGALTVADGR